MNLSAQLGELLIAYALAALGMLVALLITRAGRRAWWRWPVYSAMAMALGVIFWNLLRKHVIDPGWAAEHARLMYWTALGMYAVLGLLLGLLLGRLARPKGEPHEQEKLQ